jgi:hypothetical protein
VTGFEPVTRQPSAHVLVVPLMLALVLKLLLQLLVLHL